MREIRNAVKYELEHIPKKTIRDKVFKEPNRQNIARKPPSVSKHAVALSMCAFRYAKSLADPFSPANSGVCIPDGLYPKTHKVRQVTRAFVTTNDNGYLCVFPTPSMCSDSLVALIGGGGSDCDSGVTLTPFSANNTLKTGWTTIGNSSSNWNQADMFVNNSQITPVRGRIISSSYRLSYADTTLNEGGRIFCYQEPGHNSMSGISDSQLMSLATAGDEPHEREGCTLTFAPVEENELSMSEPSIPQFLYPYGKGIVWSNTWGGTTGFTYGNGTPAVNVGYPPGILLAVGAPNTRCILDIVTYVEYVGQKLENMVTPNASDHQGSKMVISAAAKMTEHLQNPAIKKKGRWAAMYSALSSIAKEAKPIVVPSIVDAAAALL
jgi:hypothetical protein